MPMGTILSPGPGCSAFQHGTLKSWECDHWDKARLHLCASAVVFIVTNLMLPESSVFVISGLLP